MGVTRFFILGTTGHMVSAGKAGVLEPQGHYLAWLVPVEGRSPLTMPNWSFCHPLERLHNPYSDHLAVFVPAFLGFGLGREMLVMGSPLAMLPLSGDRGGAVYGKCSPTWVFFASSGEYPFLGKTPSLFYNFAINTDVVTMHVLSYCFLLLVNCYFKPIASSLLSLPYWKGQG